MIREGDVVIILGKLDERVRAVTGEVTYGTVWYIDRDNVVVILSNYDIWRGRIREVALASENTVEETKEEENGSELPEA